MSENQAVEKTETKEERKARKAAKKQVSRLIHHLQTL